MHEQINRGGGMRGDEGWFTFVVFLTDSDNVHPNKKSTAMKGSAAGRNIAENGVSRFLWPLPNYFHV